MNHCEIIIYWSHEDQVFLAEVPKLPGCMAHGNSHKEALRNVQDAMAFWLDVAREQGELIPVPKGRRSCMPVCKTKVQLLREGATS